MAPELKPSPELASFKGNLRGIPPAGAESTGQQSLTCWLERFDVECPQKTIPYGCLQGNLEVHSQDRVIPY